jgi:hypothetical protein
LRRGQNNSNRIFRKGRAEHLLKKAKEVQEKNTTFEEIN